MSTPQSEREELVEQLAKIMGARCAARTRPLQDRYVLDLWEPVSGNKFGKDVTAQVNALADFIIQEKAEARKVDEHGNRIVALNLYEAQAVANLIETVGNSYNTGDWFTDVPLKVSAALTPKTTTESLPAQWGTNTGHGHVWPRPDGVKARCGGPALCQTCRGQTAQALARPKSSKTNLQFVTLKNCVCGHAEPIKPGDRCCKNCNGFITSAIEGDTRSVNTTKDSK